MPAFDTLPYPVLITDASGRILELNAELLALVGGDPAQWAGQPMDGLLPPAGRVFVQTHVWPMLYREGGAREIHLQLRTRNGQTLPVLVNCAADRAGDEVHFVWVLYVVYERSRFEAELLNARTRADAAARAHARSERFIKTITDAMPGLVAYWDKELRCRFANVPYLGWFGRAAGEVLGQPMQALLGDAQFAANEAHVRAALDGQSQEFECALPRGDGTLTHTLTHYLPDVAADGTVAGFFVHITDVTRLKLAETEALLAASVFRSTIEGIFVTDGSGQLVAVNPAFSTITGYSADEAIGRTPRLLKSGRHEAAFYEDVWQRLQQQGHWEGETWNRRKNGELFLVWQSITAIAGPGGAVRYVSVFNDVTDRWHDDERLRHLALHDALTGLPTRALLMERMSQLIVMTEREDRHMAVLFLDLDGFKQINDQHGHAVGDELLRHVARRLLEQVRHSDTVARMGGDEFVVVLDNPSNGKEVERVAARLIQSIHEAVSIGGLAVQVGASIGVAEHPMGGSTPAELLANADRAMYEAKRAGKNRYRFFRPSEPERRHAVES